MKVECPKCNAVYNISESKIPDKGARAQCPKCEHRFFVTLPKGGVTNQEDKSNVNPEKTIKTEKLGYDSGKATLNKIARLRYILPVCFILLVAAAIMFLPLKHLLKQPTFDEGLVAYDKNDYAAASSIFRALAEQGDVEAQTKLGAMYRDGRGVPQNFEEAAKWFLKAVEQGDAEAQIILCQMYESNKGIPKYFEKALDCYYNAAEEGNVEAQNWMGFTATRAQDYEIAIRWYREAAEQGSAKAQNALGGMYWSGQGVPQDYGKAVTWFRKAAEQGSASDQAVVGWAYQKGKGVPKDNNEAVKWFRKAAEQGHVLSQADMGEAYLRGKGVPKDFEKAVRWYRKAAEQGYSYAQARIGGVYLTGQGVPQNYIKAYMWYNLAAQSKDSKLSESCSTTRDELAQVMTPAQIAKAQRMSSEWSIKQKKEGALRKPTGDTKETPMNTLTLQQTGTGFVINSKGFVLTNYHVVEGSRKIRVMGPFESSAQVVAYDAQNDLALLRIQHSPKVTAKFRAGHGIRMGDKIIVVGYPLRGILSAMNITTGTISALVGPGNDSRLLQISAPVQQGNSGAPLLDIGGNIVGMVLARLSALKIAKLTGGLPQNVSFAIKASTIRTFLDVHGVDYKVEHTTKEIETADIGDRAKKFTVVVENWN